MSKRLRYLYSHGEAGGRLKSRQIIAGDPGHDRAGGCHHRAAQLLYYLLKPINKKRERALTER